MVNSVYVRSDSERKDQPFPLLTAFFKAHKNNEVFFKKDQFDGLLDNILVSLFAQFAKSGNCWEQSATGLVQLIRSDFPASIEIIHIRSEEDFDKHNLLVLNRNPDSNINDPKTWGPQTIIFDPWADKIISLDELMISKVLLANQGNIKGEEKDITFKVDTSFSQKLTTEHCKTIVEFLKGIQQMIKNEEEMIPLFALFASDVGLKISDMNKFLMELDQSVNNEISHFEKLENSKKPVALSRWQRFWHASSREKAKANEIKINNLVEEKLAPHKEGSEPGNQGVEEKKGNFQHR